MSSIRRTITLAAWLPAALLITAAPGAALSATRPHVELLVPKANAVLGALNLIEPSEAEFDQLVGVQFPGILSVAGFQAMRPLLALLRNSGSVPVVAYSIRWNLVYKGSKVKRLSQDFIMRPLNYGPNIALPPESVRLLSPIFNFTPAAYGASASFTERLSASRFPRAANLISCAVNLDGVVYADQTYSGPKGAQTWQRWAVDRIADRDEAAYVLKVMSDSTLGHSVDQLLALQVQRGREDRGNHTMDIYIRAREQSALEVGILLRRNGREGSMATLTRIEGTGVLSVLGNRYERRFAAKSDAGGENASR